MSNDPLSFVDTPEPAKTDAPDAPAQVDPPAVDVQPAPVVAIPEPPKVTDPAAQAQPPVQPDPAPRQDHTVPLAKYLDERNEFRDQIRTRDQQIAQLSQRLQAMEKPAQVPDVLQDPEGYARYVHDQAQQSFGAKQDELRVNMSEQMVLSGPQASAYPEALKDFNVAVQSDPFLRQRVASSVHPAQEILNWHRQHKLLNDIGTDPDAWVLRRAAELQQQQGNPALQPTPKPALQVPPPSLGRAPAGPSAATVPVGPGQAFDSLFPG